jgi:hypothetical protein
VSASGKLELDKADLMAYAHGTYYSLGQQLGSFGFSVRKKPAPKRRASRPRHEQTVKKP